MKTKLNTQYKLSQVIVGVRLKHLRNRMGLTQTQLCQNGNFSFKQTAYTKFENGIIKLYGQKLEEVANFLLPPYRKELGLDNSSRYLDADYIDFNQYTAEIMSWIAGNDSYDYIMEAFNKYQKETGKDM